MPEIKIIHGDCLEIMPTLADKSVDMILCDLPYGTTACKWDTIIPFEPLWKQYKRLIKDKGAIVLTASQPFTSALVMSNIEWFKYEYIWDKVKATGMLNASHQPLRRHENVLIFCNGKTIYNPQKIKNPKGIEKRSLYKYQRENEGGETVGEIKQGGVSDNYEADKLLPVSIQQFSKDNKPIHPTQKPVALFEYLIRTYTNEGDTVLDNCAGSGTTGIAAWRQKRNAILIEKDELYFNAAKERFYRETRQVAMF
ncbi:MAG TPA: site-specific DNA-methyltransferase [Sedimentibacter sp.]|nr:site-specific DNA-methyltransferase [Sedimentibacter sp.]